MRPAPLPDEPGNPTRDMCRRSDEVGGFVRSSIQLSKRAGIIALAHQNPNNYSTQFSRSQHRLNIFPQRSRTRSWTPIQSPLGRPPDWRSAEVETSIPPPTPPPPLRSRHSPFALQHRSAAEVPIQRDLPLTTGRFCLVSSLRSLVCRLARHARGECTDHPRRCYRGEVRFPSDLDDADRARGEHRPRSKGERENEDKEKVYKTNPFFRTGAIKNADHVGFVR